ncbi:hypothetical protein [Arthrobacter sp. H-02-3]|nr:hypothetical protein [Arthrobacter sp. H-02-3]
MIWPRTPDAPWYENYLVLLSAAVVVGIGLAYMLIKKPYRHSNVPAADAIPSGEPRITVPSNS